MKTKRYLHLILPVAISFMILFAACSNGDDYGDSVIVVTGTEISPLVKFVVEDTPSTYTIAASSTRKVKEDVTVTFEYDPSLVEVYNEKHKSSYYVAPSSAVSFKENVAVIPAGAASSEGLELQIISTEDFVDGQSYLLPVTIKSTAGGDVEVLESSRTIYLRLARVFNFNSLNMNNTNLYSNFIFPDNKAVDLSTYTYEIKCYINEWHNTPEQISRLCSFTSKTEEKSNMLRFGENGQDINSLQWVNPEGSLVSFTRFAERRWYTLSMVYDGSRLVLYVDGVKDSELNSTKGACTFQRMELGMSWESYPAKQYFNGRIAEARVWNRALSSGEINLGLCGVDSKAKGLVAYWKFNEGQGHIFHDVTGNGYDMDWSNTVRDNTGNGTLNSFDKSSYVSWLFDDLNKCSQ